VTMPFSIAVNFGIVEPTKPATAAAPAASTH